MSSERRRVFFALWPTPALAEQLQALGAGIPGREMESESLHLTLAFIGDTDAAQRKQLIQMADSMALPCFSFLIDRISSFPLQRLLWAGLRSTPPELANHVADLSEVLSVAGFSMDDRKYFPHVTLKRNITESLSETVLPEPLEWSVQSWRLVASAPSGETPRYQTLCEWPATPAQG